MTNLVWSDEFNGSSSNLDSTKWSFDTGNDCPNNCGWGNNEKETYTSRTNNAYVANGLLHIVALNDQGGSYPYSSARIKTQGHFSFTYGRVEFRAKLPAKGPYWWPACWLLGSSGGWPACGEMDVMESKGSTPGSVSGTIHKDSSGNPGVDQPVGGTFNFPTGDGTTNFHTYVLQWGVNTAGNSATISFSVDSNLPYETITSWSSSLGAYPAPFNQPFYILINMAVGGNFVGHPTTNQINSSSTFPAEMDLDYVRVYQDTGAPGPPLGIVSVSPTNGCMSGGTLITIIGSNFVAGATVKIGSATAGSVTFVDTNTLTATTPAFLSAGARNVQVTNPDSTSATLTNGFTYLSAPTFAGLDSATAATDSATLIWSAGYGVSPITYNVFEATTSGGENFGSPTLTTNSLSAFIPALNCSNTYYFVVRAVDGCGNTDNNLVERSVQPLAAPTVFAGLTNITAATDGATLTWAAASGEAPLTYNVFEATTSGAENFGSPMLTTTSLSVFVPALSCSNTYYFVVRAVGKCGNSDTNLVERSVHPLAAPTVFAGLGTAAAATDGATLSWSTASGESPLTYNVFEATASGAENFGSPVLTTSGLSAFISPLNCSNTYYFVVRAVGGCGNSDNNSVERSVLPLAAPTVFSGLSGITAATEGATLTWSAASGESPLTYTVFEATTSGAENFGTPVLTTNSLSAFIAPLYPGSNSPITYFFVVRAQGGCASGESNTVERSIQPLLDPNKSQVGDGIPNGWKQYYGFNPFDPTVAAADPDGDGFSNLQEFLAGFNPTNPVAYLHVISIAITNTIDINVIYLGANGDNTYTPGFASRTNVLEFTTGAADGSYTTNFVSTGQTNILSGGTGLGVVTNLLDAGGATNTPSRFYRVRVLVP